MDAVNRTDDDELCGFVDDRPDGCHALTVFGASLGVYPTRLDAEERIITVVLGYYALPGVSTMRIDRLQLDTQRWTLHLNR